MFQHAAPDMSQMHLSIRMKCTVQDLNNTQAALMWSNTLHEAGLSFTMHHCKQTMQSGHTGNIAAATVSLVLLLLPQAHHDECREHTIGTAE